MSGDTRRHGIGVQIETRRTSRRFDEAVLSGTGERGSEGVRELDDYWHEVERYRQVEEALRQRQKLEEMGRHAAAITHDFNNLLTAIIGNTLLLLRVLKDERSRRLAQQSLMAAERAAVVTKQLLLFSSKPHLDRCAVDLNAFIVAAVPLLRDAAGHDIVVETRLGESSGLVTIDPAQFELALLNLVTNARDAMPKGGRLVIETCWPSLSSQHSRVPPGEWAVICVTDTGIGMAAEVLARASEPFFTTKKSGSGTVLGLSMVDDLARQLGGGVSIQSERGIGTSVLIYLPHSRPDAAPTRLSILGPTGQEEPVVRLSKAKPALTQL